ncbi:hypothetical protein M673_19590 (plasmid) [Aureimonas sp. AU20]|nr:hypothetical protein M673_19590 [Aureimonas sp. AU20]
MVSRRAREGAAGGMLRTLDAISKKISIPDYQEPAI